MNKLFNPDNPVMNFLGKTLDSIWLNILWLICSLPVFTIGISTSALYYVTLKLAEDRKVEITRDFFRAFKENFKSGWKLSLIFAVFGAGLAIDGWIFWHMKTRSIAWVMGTAVFVLLLVIYMMIAVYVFPLQARFENTWRNMIRNAFVISVRFLVLTILLIAIHAAMAFVVIRLFTPAAFLGEGFVALVCSYFLKTVLAKVEESQEKAMGNGDSK